MCTVRGAIDSVTAADPAMIESTVNRPVQPQYSRERRSARLMDATVMLLVLTQSRHLKQHRQLPHHSTPARIIIIVISEYARMYDTIRYDTIR